MEMISEELSNEITCLGEQMADQVFKKLLKVSEKKGIPFSVAVMGEVGQLLCAKTLSLVVDNEEVFQKLSKQIMELIEAQARDIAEQDRNETGIWLN